MRKVYLDINKFLSCELSVLSFWLQQGIRFLIFLSGVILDISSIIPLSFIIYILAQEQIQSSTISSGIKG